MENVTGRDTQIMCEALQIAIPVMLRHSSSRSNTFDMLRILESLGNRSGPRFMGDMQEFLDEIIMDIKKGKTVANKRRTGSLDDLSEMYLGDKEIQVYLKLKFGPRLEINSFLEDLSEQFPDVRLLKRLIEKETNIEAKILTLRTFINKVKSPAKKSEYLTWLQRFEKEYCKKVANQ